MGFLSPQFFTALFSIILLDLVLGGDNAILIGLAARNLPEKQQKKAIIFGTAGAIVIRSTLTLVAVWLLSIPGLRLAGGILLLWIAYKLLIDDKGHEDVKAGDSMWAAIRTIIIADAIMGLDNVLAVAGAAHGSYVLVVFGLLVSIPIVVWGSTLVIKAINRFPIIIDLGAAVIAYTASKMIMEEPIIHAYFVNNIVHWGVTILLVGGVLLAGKMKQKAA